MRSPRHRAAQSTMLALAVALASFQTACIPDKPMEDPTPVGGRPTATVGAGAAGGPVAGGSPAAGGVAVPATPAAGGATRGKLGEPVKGGDLTLTVAKADRTETQLILNITLANAGANDILMNPALELVVTYTNNGAPATAVPAAFGVPAPRFDNNVKRGASSTGNVAYQMPKAAENVVLTWRAQQVAGGGVLAVFDLPPA